MSALRPEAPEANVLSQKPTSKLLEHEINHRIATILFGKNEYATSHPSEQQSPDLKSLLASCVAWSCDNEPRSKQHAKLSGKPHPKHRVTNHGRGQHKMYAS